MCANGHASGLPQNLWGEALMYVIWVKNRSVSRVLDGKTLYELLTGMKPDLRNMHEWGVCVWVHNPSHSKLDMQAWDSQWNGFL
jgi:hypothetical protein